ncbi:MAG TPA: sigma-54 dependent transcriptional regulator [Polyangiaceae bacterium]|nr:sigma-54 dependent transcriptional regulator [Polyangiaceae bacterium]
MPGMDGLELLACVRDRWPDIPVMLVTVEAEIATVVAAVQRGAVNYLVKPVSPSVVLAATAKALARASDTANLASSAAATDMVGCSEGVLRARRLVALAARSDVNVVVVGETGCGKELVARAIHRLSPQCSRPFVAHNCATTAPDMFDAEFFGHTRGAFTGAHRDRPGLLRAADRGVLFLDELECLSLANQAKLLRVLDDGEVRPVGSDRTVVVSARFVAATNRDPEAMIAAGELREDLYYRLRGIQIALPPLRERLEDLPLLAAHFLHGTGKALTPACVEALQRCSWPGNVRQLRSVIRCALARARGAAVDVGDLDLDVPGGIGNGSTAPRSDWKIASAPPTGVTLEALEREAIVHAMEVHGGNRNRVAQELGIHRSTLRRRLRELKLEGLPLTSRRKDREGE